MLLNWHYLSDKRAVAWLYDGKVFRNFPVALLDEC